MNVKKAKIADHAGMAASGSRVMTCVHLHWQVYSPEAAACVGSDGDSQASLNWAEES